MRIRLWLGAAIASIAATWSAAPAPVTLLGTLSNAGEPPEAATSMGSGSAVVIVDVDTLLMAVQVVFEGLGGAATGAQIHCCTLSAGTGTAAAATRSLPGFPIGAAAGDYDTGFDMSQGAVWDSTFVASHGGSNATAFAALAAGLQSGHAYLNITSALSPGGEIRAFFSAEVVPLPATLLLLASGVAGLAGTMRRRAGDRHPEGSSPRATDPSAAQR